MRANFSSSVTWIFSPGAISSVYMVARSMGAVVADAEAAKAARTGAEKRMMTGGEDDKAFARLVLIPRLDDYRAAFSTFCLQVTRSRSTGKTVIKKRARGPEGEQPDSPLTQGYCHDIYITGKACSSSSMRS